MYHIIEIWCSWRQAIVDHMINHGWSSYRPSCHACVYCLSCGNAGRMTRISNDAITHHHGIALYMYTNTHDDKQRTRSRDLILIVLSLCSYVYIMITTRCCNASAPVGTEALQNVFGLMLCFNKPPSTVLGRCGAYYVCYGYVTSNFSWGCGDATLCKLQCVLCWLHSKYMW